jgi:proline racemase
MEPVHTVDYHTGGEPFRILAGHGLDIPGATVAERRVAALASAEVQELRRLLCYEPRGHADMYGGIVVPPDDGLAHVGVLFWHKDGFSTACGHGTMALGVWAVESGLVPRAPGGVTEVVIDVPSGRVTARVHSAPDGRTTAVDFVNVPSWLVKESLTVATARGEVTVDVGFGGAIYAMLDVTGTGLSVTPERVGEVIALGREVKWALNDHAVAQHPTDPRLSGIYGTIVYETLPDDAGRLHQRNATVFADGELDRSPCGSGTAARLAVLTAQGRLGVGDTLVHDSIVGSRFLGVAIGETTAAGRPAVIPRVTGTAHKTGESWFTVDPGDDMVPGFVLR